MLLCKKHQIDAHITVMVGYPWESKKELNNTLDFAHKIFRENLAASLQATIIIPYPGTPLFKSCQKNKLLFSFYPFFKALSIISFLLRSSIIACCFPILRPSCSV